MRFSFHLASTRSWKLKCLIFFWKICRSNSQIFVLFWCPKNFIWWGIILLNPSPPYNGVCFKIKKINKTFFLIWRVKYILNFYEKSAQFKFKLRFVLVTFRAFWIEAINLLVIPVTNYYNLIFFFFKRKIIIIWLNRTIQE